VCAIHGNSSLLSKVLLFCYHYNLLLSTFLCRDPDPKSRPQFQKIIELLAGNRSYLLGWSDEDREIASKDASKLGAPLESANNLYYDLQTTYRHNV